MNQDLDTCIHLDIYFASGCTITAQIYDEHCSERCLKPGKRYDPECDHWIPVRDTMRVRDWHEEMHERGYK